MRLPLRELSMPLLIVAAVVLVWAWKPWQRGRSVVVAEITPSATATLLPSATYVVVPTATPLNSPTPTPAPTLPPNQTIHIVESGETIITIAKLYGTTKAAILQANQLKESSILKIGQQLIIPLLAADTPTPTVTPTPSPTPFEYTVRTGDTLSELAKKFGTTVEALMQANGITDATSLQVGSKLVIVNPPDFTATMAYETYEVQAGDTLISLSGKFGVKVATIKEVNGLTSDRLGVGQKLRIPVGTATPTPTLTATTAPTATPAPPYSAPALLAPPDDAAFGGGPDQLILLSWASVGILGQDEWYVLHLQRLEGRGSRPQLVWTKVTSWRLTPELYVGGMAEPARFNWWAVVMRQTGASGDGTPQGEEISPPSQIRTFSWK